jgi:hypothetical protein
LKSPTNSFFFVLSKYFDNTNYDPARIMDIARGPIRVHAAVIERQPHALIPSVYT